jgi:FMN phosphatase YigB (HAD superfamily)
MNKAWPWRRHRQVPAWIGQVLDETGLRPLFVATRGADEANSKPDPLMLTQILDELGIAPHQAVMIGDSIHDMAMAEALAMPRIGVAGACTTVRACWPTIRWRWSIPWRSSSGCWISLAI